MRKFNQQQRQDLLNILQRGRNNAITAHLLASTLGYRTSGNKVRLRKLIKECIELENDLIGATTGNLVQDLIQPFIRGAQYPAISDANLKSLKIPLPSLETQQKIVHKLDSVFAEVDGLITDYQSKREDLEALKASLLDSAFKGEL